MSKNSDVVIIAAKRSPLGSFMGNLSPLTSPQIASQVIQAIISEHKIKPELIEEVYMGCVLPAAVGQAPARQAALNGGLLQSTPCTTVNKVCGSAMKSIMIGYDMIVSGNAQCVLAGGMESMSNAPYLLPRAREGYRIGHHQVIDHMFFDGLENASDNNLMGHFAERCADKYGFSREQQDHYAIESVKRARQATAQHWFEDEIAPITLSTKGKEQTVSVDEQPEKSKIEKIPQLKPAFRNENGTVTAANSSSISDGAAAVVLMDAEFAKQQGFQPMARIIGQTSFARAPEDFTIAPVGAIKKLQDKIGWGANDIDLYEINEAFAVVSMAAMQELSLDHSKVNVHGGACALGHPIGASGARIVVTLLHALRQRQQQRGIASLCIGGGEATALAIELV